MLELEFAQVTDTGRVREHNEDFLGYADAQSQGWLFVLADGVGGHEQGEVASRAAVERVLAGFRAAPPAGLLAPLLGRLVQSANLHVYETGKAASAGGVPMATTIVAMWLRHDQAAVAHVGDSRCYLIRQGHAEALTRDHTVAAEHVRMGVLSSGEADDAGTRHLLSRSLGSDLFVAVDTSSHAIVPGDVLLLCSDGLHHSVEPADMARIALNGGTMEEAARTLIDVANKRDGSDNVSVQLIRILGVERVGMYRGRPYRLR